MLLSHTGHHKIGPTDKPAMAHTSVSQTQKKTVKGGAGKRLVVHIDGPDASWRPARSEMATRTRSAHARHAWRRHGQHAQVRHAACGSWRARGRHGTGEAGRTGRDR